ncbi:DUF4238 domain-containing protein [Streptococcus danieliae]|uniref:DUF4238 domain-containing protein n=1 Tax=Streptococcus danieliae TaxID=747656 RepID=A0A7Z0RQA6_9STRE|nr:DUF4238 domain-containing protein [Streptococcus danieliae]MBF0716886.1 DUF4238 domain-containing protein [Streptococcus danieliae]NYS48816.1 DUF4238 domain-containing protein [Streptococcus danieliae]
MKNKQLTKKQHYYPRCLLKHFADEQGLVNVYVRQANKLLKLNYENICASNYSYESDDTIDNILENKLSRYEAKVSVIIGNILSRTEHILKNFTEDTSIITEEQQSFLYKYMWLQYMRTDAGRIIFMMSYENICLHKLKNKPRFFPIELDEIKDNNQRIKTFNKLFKQDGVLENVLKLFERPDTMNFHIAISEENLLTSDNPVIGTNEWKHIILPIAPHICIEFINKSIDKANTNFVMLAKMHSDYLNKATINTANYFVLSNEEFTFSQNNYLYSRFKNPSWKFSKPHFNS